MPINVERDERWGQLGTGLGNLLSGLIEGWQQKKAQQGVAQIWSDPKVPADQKMIESLKQYGDIGGQVGLQLLKAQTMQQQLLDITAETAERGAQTRASDALAAIRQAQAPYAGPLEQAKTDVELGRLPLQQAQTGEALAKTQEAQVGAEFKAGPETQAERQLGGQRAAETEKAQVETDIAKMTRDRMAGVMKPGQPGEQGHPLDPLLAIMPDIDDATKAGAKIVYDNVLGGSKGDMAAAQKAALEYTEKYRQSKVLPEQTEKKVEAAAQGASAAKTFMTSFLAKPDTGLFSGAPLFNYLEKHGMGTGDVNRLTQNDVSLRLTAENLSAGGMGGGFMSTLRLKFAADLAPGLMKSPLANVINMDLLSNAKLAELRALRANLDPKTTQSARASVDEQLADWQEVKDMTAAFQTYITPKGKTVLVHNGSEIDPKNFNVKIDANRVYDASGGKQYQGSDIVAKAQQYGMDPIEFARQLEINIK